LDGESAEPLVGKQHPQVLGKGRTSRKKKKGILTRSSAEIRISFERKRGEIRTKI